MVKVDRIIHALCIKCMKLISKYFFLPDLLYLGVILHLDKYIFPPQTCVIGGGVGVILDFNKYIFSLQTCFLGGP